MAKQGTKTEMLRCKVTVDAVVFEHVKRDGEEWKVVDSLAVECANIPDKLEDGDSFASMKAYGIRAFLSDRTSQFREFGISSTLKEMTAVAEQLAAGVYRSKRKAKKGNDIDLLARAVAELKQISIEVATATVKQLSAEKLAMLLANASVAEKMAEIKLATAQADAVELDDLFEGA